jgi:FtsZ-binding cell division protein ZapB
MGMPDLVRNGQLTGDGEKVIALVEATLDQAENLVEGQDVSSLNALSGPFQDYYINVRKAKLSDAATWLKDRPYAASHLWSIIEAQEVEAAKTAKVDTLEARFAKLEEQMKLALETIQAKDAEIAALKEPAAETVDEPPAPKSHKTRKTQDAEPDAPAEEPTAEEEPDASDEEAEA